ncbi:hypothetical protein [Sulfuritalea hydrogenivorans]|uniref:Uncharacterized protein n=1 Tax=Sulfuritalea hydrogenivorans sk43H TaxID=1223802 RepID=W0SBG9_9PROT|nr:hypothetical protein [Sulfuritalea hydrogenivorans]BAO28100.1 hypothetical protein SUTH_00284 [Sulfuritalea hydrogenivorans sk43H]
MTEFQRLDTGRLWSVMGWDQLTEFWKRIDPAAGWYLLAVGVSPAPTLCDAAAITAFIARIDALLRAEHHESYCGIVYADDLESPRLIKIYDPNNLGSSCGSSKNPPGPGWIMSRVEPDAIPASRPAPENRKRWWHGLLGDS